MASQPSLSSLASLPRGAGQGNPPSFPFVSLIVGSPASPSVLVCVVAYSAAPAAASGGERSFLSLQPTREPILPRPASPLRIFALPSPGLLTVARPEEGRGSRVGLPELRPEAGCSPQGSHTVQSIMSQLHKLVHPQVRTGHRDPRKLLSVGIAGIAGRLLQLSPLSPDRASSGMCIPCTCIENTFLVFEGF